MYLEAVHILVLAICVGHSPLVELAVSCWLHVFGDLGYNLPVFHVDEDNAESDSKHGHESGRLFMYTPPFVCTKYGGTF